MSSVGTARRQGSRKNWRLGRLSLLALLLSPFLYCLLVCPCGIRISLQVAWKTWYSYSHSPLLWGSSQENCHHYCVPCEGRIGPIATSLEKSRGRGTGINLFSLILDWERWEIIKLELIPLTLRRHVIRQSFREHAISRI